MVRGEISSAQYRLVGRHVANMGEMASAYSTLVINPEKKIPLGKSSKRREDNIKIDQKETKRECGQYSCGSRQEMVTGS
jgi:hypothetical protein